MEFNLELYNDNLEVVDASPLEEILEKFYQFLPEISHTHHYLKIRFSPAEGYHHDGKSLLYYWPPGETRSTAIEKFREATRGMEEALYDAFYIVFKAEERQEDMPLFTGTIFIQ